MAKDSSGAQSKVVPRPKTSTPNPSNFEKKGAWPIGGGGETRPPSPNGRPQ